MPLFVLSCTDHEGTVEKRLATRPQHIERLQKLNVWLKEEPFLKAGVYAHIDVKPFNKAFPQG